MGRRNEVEGEALGRGREQAGYLRGQRLSAPPPGGRSSRKVARESRQRAPSQPSQWPPPMRSCSGLASSCGKGKWGWGNGETRRKRGRPRALNPKACDVRKRAERTGCTRSSRTVLLSAAATYVADTSVSTVFHRPACVTNTLWRTAAIVRKAWPKGFGRES